MNTQTTVESPAASEQQDLGDMGPLLQGILKFIRHGVTDKFLTMAELKSGCDIDSIHLNDVYQWHELSTAHRRLLYDLFNRFVQMAIYMEADEYGFGFLLEEGMEADAEQIDKDTPSERAEQIREEGRANYEAIIEAVDEALSQMPIPEDSGNDEAVDEALSQMPIPEDNDNDEADEAYFSDIDNEHLKIVVDNLGYIIDSLCTLSNRN